jgi:MFS-type transporter involved in bile tolerance (Atg22 family)
MRRLDLLGACVATAIFALAILVFISRLAGRVAWEHWLSVALLLAAVPLCYLLLKAPEHHRSSLYYLQIGLMLAYLAIEFVHMVRIRSEEPGSEFAALVSNDTA